MTRPFVFNPPPALASQSGSAFTDLVRLMQRLLAPDGCPWDRKQSPQSLCRYVMEEASELIDAIQADDDAAVCEELGDLALQIAFLGELYRDRGSFGPDDALIGIVEKLVRRHPHVFGNEEAATPEDVERSWEQIKRQEKRQRPLLDGVPRNLPALQRADRMARLAAAVGFDWPDAASCKAKVDEEFAELTACVADGDRPGIEEEYGDLLLAVANWGRHLGVEPEASLRAACDKFQGRFAAVEGRVREVHGDWPRDEQGRPCDAIAQAELERYWEEAKQKGG